MKPIDDKIRWIIKESFKESTRLGYGEITPDHMVLVILNDYGNNVINTLSSMGFKTEDLSSKIEGFLRLKIKNPQIEKKLLLENENILSFIPSPQPLQLPTYFIILFFKFLYTFNQ